MKQDKQHQEERELTPLEMLLEIMDEENLLRFRRRFEKRGNDRMADMLSVEIRKREEKEREKSDSFLAET